MKYAIDRFEGDFAVLEDEKRNMVDIPRSLLPEEAKESDVLNYENDLYSIDTEETMRRKDDAGRRMERLWKE